MSIEHTLAQYLSEANLLFFKVICYNSEGQYVDEFDNYELKNYNLKMIETYGNYIVENTFVDFHKHTNGSLISHTTIHVYDLIKNEPNSD